LTDFNNLGVQNPVYMSDLIYDVSLSSVSREAAICLIWGKEVSAS